MPNTKSAKKALRSSLRKKQYNNFWKNKIKLSQKTLDDSLQTKEAGVDILNADMVALQKALDKAAKNNVIHKNKANRLKSRYAKKITAKNKTKDTTDKKSTPSARRPKSSTKSKS